jgi:all-trans-retinol dehydrogenase (NAD+)
MKLNLKGKTAVITGGASGLGRLVALDLARRGARVIAWDLGKAALDSLVSDAASFGGDVVSDIVDISDKTAVAAAAAKILAERGAVDILVNNAGIVSGKTLLETSDEKIEKTFQVNVLAHFWTVKAFLPAMLAQNSGHILTISSAAGLIGVCGLADYSASKFAVFGFNESLRMELRKMKSRVRTTIVCPFYTNTGLFAGVQTRWPLLLPILEPEVVAKRIVKAILKGRKRVITPRFVYVALPLRIFPVGVLDVVSDLCGISSSMDHFTGRE